MASCKFVCPDTQGLAHGPCEGDCPSCIARADRSGEHVAVPRRRDAGGPRAAWLGQWRECPNDDRTRPAAHDAENGARTPADRRCRSVATTRRPETMVEHAVSFGYRRRARVRCVAAGGVCAGDQSAPRSNPRAHPAHIVARAVVAADGAGPDVPRLRAPPLRRPPERSRESIAVAHPRWLLSPPSRASPESCSRAPPLYRLPRTPVIGLSLPTAVSLLLTSMGLLLARATSGVMRVATSPGPGGILLRRLALPVVIAPLLLGLVVTRLSAARADGGSFRSCRHPRGGDGRGESVSARRRLRDPSTARTMNVEASRARAQSLVEQAPDGIFVANLDGRYTDVNEAGCRMLQYSREEIVGEDHRRPDSSGGHRAALAVEGTAPPGDSPGWRVETSSQGRQLPPGGGEREDSSGRAMAGVRS